MHPSRKSTSVIAILYGRSTAAPHVRNIDPFVSVLPFLLVTSLFRYFVASLLRFSSSIRAPSHNLRVNSSAGIAFASAAPCPAHICM